jgi:hypothetical protein
MTLYRGPSTIGTAAPNPQVHIEPRFMWYQTMWSLATHYANRLPRGGDEARAKGREYAVVLAQSAYVTLGNLYGDLVDRDPVVTRKLETFLRDTILPSAIVLTAGLSKSPFSVETDLFLSDSELLGLIPGDNSVGALAARVLVEEFILPGTWSPRTHYNLACYLAQDERRLGMAIAQLAKAFDPDKSTPAELYLLADWAWEDQSLRPLWENPEFDHLTAPYRTSQEIHEWLGEQKS